MEGEEEENNNTMNKTFLKITQVMEVAQAMIAVLAKNDDKYVWISKQGIIFLLVNLNVIFRLICYIISSYFASLHYNI